MDREIHIWLDKIDFADWYDDDVYLCNTYAETEVMLKCEQDIIHTTQTHFCQFKYGKIFVHTGGSVHEITRGDCEGTNRDIKEADNIEKMLLSGEFDWF